VLHVGVFLRSAASSLLILKAPTPPTWLPHANRDRQLPMLRSEEPVNDLRAIAFESPLVRPVRSATSRNATLPACATTPDPSPVTDNPHDHEVRFTYGVPSTLENLRRRNPKFPLLGRHFRASTRRSTRDSVNDPV